MIIHTKFALFYLLFRFYYTIHVLKTRIFCLSLVGYITKCMYLKKSIVCKMKDEIYERKFKDKHVLKLVLIFIKIGWNLPEHIISKILLCYFQASNKLIIVHLPKI